MTTNTASPSASGPATVPWVVIRNRRVSNYEVLKCDEEVSGPMQALLASASGENNRLLGDAVFEFINTVLIPTTGGTMPQHLILAQQKERFARIWGRPIHDVEALVEAEGERDGKEKWAWFDAETYDREMIAHGFPPVRLVRVYGR